MKKRLLSLLLILTLSLGLLPPVRAEADLSFLAVNDTLPYALDAATMPFYSGGTLYIPYNIYEQVSGLGVWVSYSPTDLTLLLFNKSRRLLFDISDGTVEDENGDTYELGVIVRGGMVFLPANYCISYFGASLNYLTSLGGYTILRITTGTQVLSNSAFVTQADTLIEEMAAAYLASLAPTQPAASTVTVTPAEPAPTVQEPEPAAQPEDPEPPEEEVPDPEETEAAETPVCQIYPLILGPSREAADWLEAHGQKAAFFLTARQIQEHPALVRQLLCAGHTIGLAGSTASALDRANTALYEAAGEQTLLALDQTGLSAPGYVLCPGTLDAETFYWNPTAEEAPLPVVLDWEDPLLTEYLDAFLEHCTLYQLNETNVPALAGTTPS